MAAGDQADEQPLDQHALADGLVAVGAWIVLAAVAGFVAASLSLAPAFADGGAKDVKASSTSITGATVVITGTGYGASYAVGAHYGYGSTYSSAFEFSHAEAQAGHKHRRSHHYGNGQPE